ncbi:MAG TPA: hypothetical protein VJJ23_03385 [Candidatus Nanoarchaeia archaeon]|nr:hypothetical protein [Candidatus Nanoarchaeia archaeon]
MIENLKRDFEILQENEKFKEWKEKNNESYLCSAFLMNEDNKGNWQIDYFNPSSWDITSFLVREKEIKINNPEKIFQKEKEKVKELVIENVKVSYEKVNKMMKELLKEKYSSERPDKKVFVLQVIEETIWNVTYINSSFNILNVKISAENGKVLSENLSPVFSFKTDEK